MSASGLGVLLLLADIAAIAYGPTRRLGAAILAGVVGWMGCAFCVVGGERVFMATPSWGVSMVALVVSPACGFLCFVATYILFRRKLS